MFVVYVFCFKFPWAFLSYDKIQTILIKALFRGFLSYLPWSRSVKLAMPVVPVFPPYSLHSCQTAQSCFYFCKPSVCSWWLGLHIVFEMQRTTNLMTLNKELFILFFLPVPKFSTIAAWQVEEFIALLTMISRSFSFDTINLELTKV